MKKLVKYLPEIIRISLSLWLCYGVYTETGIFTAPFAVLVTITFELQGPMIKK